MMNTWAAYPLCVTRKRNQRDQRVTDVDSATASAGPATTPNRQRQCAFHLALAAGICRQESLAKHTNDALQVRPLCRKRETPRAMGVHWPLPSASAQCTRVLHECHITLS